MIEMVKKSILPSATEWLTGLVGSVEALKSVKVDASGIEMQLESGGDILARAFTRLTLLEKDLAAARAEGETFKKAKLFREKVFGAMAALRVEVDALEALLPADFYPFPTYEDMLFRF